MERQLMTLEELSAAADLADKLALDVDACVLEANNQQEHEPIRGVDPVLIKHGSWAIEERAFWNEVSRRLRSIHLVAKG